MDNATTYQLSDLDLNKRQLVDGDVFVIVWSIIHLVLMFAIIGGNLLTVCAIKLSRKISALISNQFVFSLALSDIMVGVTLPYHYSFLIDGQTLGNNETTCILRFVLIILACSSSIYNLLAIATDRYIAIVHPLRYSRYMTRKIAMIIIIFGWTLAFSVATVPIYWNRWSNNNNDDDNINNDSDGNFSMKTSCSLESILPDNYVDFVVTPMFISIWITMSIVYFRIWREAVGHAKRLRTVAGFNQNGPNLSDSKSVQVVLLILGCFSLCWMPFFIVMLYITTTGETTNPIIYESTFTMAITNSCMNPIIYAWKNTNFRRAFWCLLRCKSPNNSTHKRSFITNHVPTTIRKKNTTYQTNGHCNNIMNCLDDIELNVVVANNNHDNCLKRDNSDITVNTEVSCGTLS